MGVEADDEGSEVEGRLLARVLHPGHSLRRLGPGLYSALSEDEAGAPYDRHAALYDRAVSTNVYLRLAWGMTRDANARFIADAFAARPGGVLLDVAAGTGVDAAAAWATSARPVIVLDRSVAMLLRAQQRLAAEPTAPASPIAFLQADAFDLPLGDATIDTVLCHGAHHLFEDTTALARAWRRVLAPGGDVHVSSLVTGRWLGDRYLGLLHRSGEIAAPRDASDFGARLEAVFGVAPSMWRAGNFAYARVALSAGSAPAPDGRAGAGAGRAEIAGRRGSSTVDPSR